MKVTVGDVVNNKVNIRDYMGYDEETGRIYVCGEALDIVLVDKSEEWKKLMEQNKRLREALEFYADEENWISALTSIGDFPCEVEKDQGEIARQALEAIKDE